jgi:hypothetical protein
MLVSALIALTKAWLGSGSQGTVFSNMSTFFFFSFFAVLGLELRAYTLSHSTSPFFVMGLFKIGSCELFFLGWL